VPASTTPVPATRSTPATATSATSSSTTTSTTSTTSSSSTASDDGLDHKHNDDDVPAIGEPPIPKQKGFFDCKEDHEARSPEEWIRCQGEPSSKLMKHAQNDMKTNKRSPYF
jgi:hypothetical protein